MRNLDEGSREARSQESGELFVEFLDLLGAHTSADTRASSDAAPPSFGRVRGIDIVGERLEATVPGFAEIAKPQRMNTQPAPHLPIGIVMLDELLRRTDHVAGERNPVKVRDDQDSIRLEYPRGLDSGLGAVEPVPALTRCDNVKCGIWKAGVLRPSHPVLHADTGARIEFAGGLEHRFSRIETYNVAAAACEPAGEASRTRPEVNDRLTMLSYPVCRESLKQRIGKARSMAGIVL